MVAIFRFLVLLGIVAVTVIAADTARQCSRIKQKDIEKAFADSEPILKELEDRVNKQALKGKIIKVKISDLSLNRQKNTDPTVRGMERGQMPFDVASNLLWRRFNLSRDEISKELPKLPLTGELSSSRREDCRQNLTVDECQSNSKYRTANGQCNNLRNPTWGSSLACQQRILTAHYSGNNDFRLSRSGDPLPNPRTLSLNLHYHYNRPTNYVTHMYMFYGQLLDHDLTQTPITTTVNNSAIECCPPEEENDPQCRPILVPNNDPFYSQFNVTCLNFVRSAVCPTCVLGPREQMNQVTSFIDASFIYGNSINQTNSLRTNDGTGRLRMENSAYGDLMPSSPDPQNDQCSFPDTNDICFESGDARANQHTVLTSLHTIFMREHNRLASELRQMNPRWDDERIFQEARRIVGAIMQIIAYKEFLPITLGNDRMNYFNLWTGQRTRYDPNENPSMIIEFTTAAFRFGHSLINSAVVNYPRNNSNGQRLLRNEFFQPFDLRRGYAGPLLRGATDSPAQWFDRHLVPDVTNFLYRVRGNDTGLDLAAINIYRGRDHGTPTYVDTVRFCSEGAIDVRSFDDLTNQRLMNYEQANALRRNYRFVDDVDLWPGILMETPNDGAVVGPTAACIIGLQFRKLKFGDRFYFEHMNQRGSFTNQQLNQLSRMSLSRVICLNSEVSQLPSNAMIFNSRNNPLINCKNVRGIDTSYWKE